MNKAELVSHVAAETSTTTAAAERMVGAVFSAIADALAGDEPVAIAGFGTFSTRDRPAREGRNPRTGETIAIAASRTPAFKPGKGPARCGQPRAWVMFPAGRGCRKFCDSPILRTDAPSCAQLESPRVRVPYNVGWESLLSTPLRGSAHTAYCKRYLSAYTSLRLSVVAPHHTYPTRSHAPRSDRCHYIEPPTTITFVVGYAKSRIRRPADHANI